MLTVRYRHPPLKCFRGWNGRINVVVVNIGGLTVPIQYKKYCTMF